MAPRRGALHSSGAPEADRHLAAFDDDRDAALAREADHAVELLLVLLDVDVGERDSALRVVLTGRGRVGSGVLSEDLDPLLAHRSLRRPSMILEAGALAAFPLSSVGSRSDPLKVRAGC